LFCLCGFGGYSSTTPTTKPKTLKMKHLTSGKKGPLLERSIAIKVKFSAYELCKFTVDDEDGLK